MSDLYNTLAAQAKKMQHGVDTPAAKKAIAHMIAEYNKASESERQGMFEVVRGHLDARKDKLVHKLHKPTFDVDVFVFQTGVKAEVLALEKSPDSEFKKEIHESRTYQKFEHFKGKNNHEHPDGYYGRRTYAVYSDTDCKDCLDKLIHKNAEDTMKTKHQEPEVVEQTVQAKAPVETPPAKPVETPKKGSLKADPQDVADYTFKRAGVLYFEKVIAKNPTAADMTPEQLKAIGDAVHDYCFDANGEPKKLDYRNRDVIAQIRAAVRTKTHDLKVTGEDGERRDMSLTDEQINALTFDEKSIHTRSIVGSFKAAEKSVENADQVLQKQADAIQIQVGANKTFLESKGIKVDGITPLSGVDESQRGLHFKTAYMPALTALAGKETDEVNADYQRKIDAEKAKLVKYDIMNAVVDLGFPPIVDKQKMAEDGVTPLYTTKTFTKYDTQGNATSKDKQIPILEKVPDVDDLTPIDLGAIKDATQRQSTIDALKATGLMNDDGTYKTLSYTLHQGDKEIAKTVSAETALKDPKTYHDVIRTTISQTYALTEQEKKAHGGAELDGKIAKEKIAVLSTAETATVRDAVSKLEAERNEKLANTPSTLLLKEANTSLKNYKDAVRFYNQASDYETYRLFAELSGDKVDKTERQTLKAKRDTIDAALEKRIEKAKADVTELTTALAAEKNDSKKAALQSSLQVAETEVTLLTDMPKKFDQRDKVPMVVISMNGSKLFHVDGETKKERKAERQQGIEAAGTTALPSVDAPATKAAAAPTKASQDNIPAGASLEKVEMTEVVKADLKKFEDDAKALKSPALAVDNEFANKKDKNRARKEWKQAVGTLEDDLAELKTLNKQDKADGTEFDQSFAASLKAVKDLGVVVTDQFEIDETQTLENVKKSNRDKSQVK